MMEVKTVHMPNNHWRIYPLDNNDFYLGEYENFFELKLHIQQNFYAIKRNECQLEKCQQCQVFY